MFDFEIHQISGLRPSLLVNKLRLNEKTLLLLFAKIRLLENGCWFWMAAKQKGYGAVRIRALSASPLRAHRVCYELVHGALDAEMDLHHKVEDGCIGPSCVNPDHLLAVTKGEHTRDLTPNSVTYKYAHRDVCDQGHEYTKENTRVVDGVRQCRICDAGRAMYRRESIRTRPRFAKDPAKLKTHCFRGHSLEDESNIRMVPSPSGEQRVCLACEKVRDERYRARREGRPIEVSRLPTDRCKRGHLMEGENVYVHPDGKRRSCMACRALLFTEKGTYEEFEMAVGESTGESRVPISRKLKTHCKNGHALEGDNIYIRSDGKGRGCNACRLAAVKRNQAANRETYLKRRAELRREHKQADLESIKEKIVAIYAENLDDDELIRRLREVLPPPEQ